MMHPNLHGDWYCGPGGLFNGFHFGGLLPLAFLALFLLLLYSLVRSQASSKSSRCTPAGNPPSPLSILEARYASGEIAREDFLQKKQDLKI